MQQNKSINSVTQTHRFFEMLHTTLLKEFCSQNSTPKNNLRRFFLKPIGATLSPSLYPVLRSR